MSRPAQRLVLPARGRAELVELPGAELPLPDGAVRITTSYTGLSAGTELSWYNGTNPFLNTGWDGELGLFDGSGPAQSYPVNRLGYMESGVVVESRSAGLPAGTRVAAAYGHATSHLADPLREHVVPLPDDLDLLLGVYVAHMGPICANGLLHAAAEVVGGDVRTLGDGVRGRRVVLTGAGVVALLTGLFALHHGAAEVVVVDSSPQRLAVAAALGLTPVEESADEPLAAPMALRRRWRHGAADHGADVVFQCRGRPVALATALRCARPQGTVIDLAFYQGGAAEVRLGEEFHHNGLTVRCAQIGRVPRGQAHLWDRARLSVETIDLLAARGEQLRRHLVTEVVPLAQAPSVLADLATRRRGALQVVFSVD